ncbi:MAG: ATP phosphoribosyltransferase regulatory subunit [Epulopiscium sp.]|jgi:ATP phosphoribosyltransferase regulatory subunit|nr:ATP phosphoribosyltransferase regulatory subunit [Candidatus Epulonipiscium sp.]HOQ16705.1 ATP phosphoribosyltransferase regulatory subunit [Defluviitaleaceae bacterium]HPT75115.1 ATP phosphoribosyltransferase regulatory subunit [Defluviitaleaceae bacterium]
MNYKLHTPEGVRDLLPEECAKKKEIEKRIECVFNRYGYYNVETPTFEYYDVFLERKEDLQQKHIYKFADREGDILALRPDMTPPIARIGATVFKEERKPVRLCYLGNAFRFYESLQGKNREFSQAGVELLGINSDEADGEVIAVAIHSLLAAGLNDFQIDLGQVEFFKGILQEAGLSEDEGEELRQLIENKDFIGVEEFIEQFQLNPNLKELFLDLPKLCGPIDIIEKTKVRTENSRARRALEKLENVYSILRDYGIEKYVSFDLGMVNRINYYTGIIFRGYTFGTGSSILDGGRYDRLLGEFGHDCPAVGFGIMTDQLINAINRQKIKIPVWKVDTLLVYNKEGRKQALMTADTLRREGMYIENSLLDGDIEAQKEYARSKNIDGILYFIDEQKIELIDLKNNQSVKTTVDQLLERSEGREEN